MRKLLTMVAMWGMLTTIAFAQSKTSLLEEVKQQCAHMPLEKRATVRVSDFTVTTNTNDPATERNASAANTIKALGSLFGHKAPEATTIPPTLGNNLSTMLTDALQRVNCYRVLLSLKNNNSLTEEIDSSNNGTYSNHQKSIAKGKQLSAQIVVRGEIIEYSTKEKGVNVSVVSTNKKYIKIGFNLQMINPATSDVIASHTFRVETMSGNGVSIFGIQSSNSDPAIAAVLNNGVQEAVQYMERVRDSLNLTSDYFIARTDPNATNETEVTLLNADYNAFTSLGTTLSHISTYKAMEKSFSGTVATFAITHTGNSDNLLEELSKQTNNKYKVIQFQEGKIQIKTN